MNKNKGISQSVAMILVAGLSSVASVFVARAAASDQTQKALDNFRVQNAIDIGQVKTDVAGEIGDVKTSIATIAATNVAEAEHLKSLDRNYENLAGAVQSLTSTMLNNQKR